VPRVFSTGVIGRRPWIAYELIQGVPLTETLLEGPLEVAEVLALLRDVASVLEHAHRRNIVHRNLRPDVLLNAPGRAHPICITGWSDARVDDGSRERVDHRADVFALGAVAFTALTGTWTDELTAVQRAPGAPRGLTLLIDRMLAPEPEARPSCAEVRATAIQIVAELTKASAPSEDDGVAIEEVGVEWADDGRSRVSPLKDMWKVIREAMTIRKNIKRGVYNRLPA
jgi:serine/threonine protein kinase